MGDTYCLPKIIDQYIFADNSCSILDTPRNQKGCVENSLMYPGTKI